MSRLDGFNLDSLIAVDHQLGPMLTTILSLSAEITSKGIFDTDPSGETASKTSEFASEYKLGSERGTYRTGSEKVYAKESGT